MSEFVIRKESIDSLETSFKLLSRFFQEEGFNTPLEELKSNLHKMITSPSNAVFLAWRENEALGVATVTTSIGLEYGLSAEIDDLYVLPDERNSGIASALIEEVNAWCRSRGVSTILVTVTPEGDEEHKLLEYYQRRGFSNDGRRILECALTEER